MNIFSYKANNIDNGDIMSNNKFAKCYSIYKYVFIFVIFSIVGFVYETILDYIQNGTCCNKQELLYGPFTIVYGIGVVVFTAISKKFKNMTVIFLVSSFFGGMLEYLYSFFQEKFYGTISWDYSNAITNIDGRTTLIYAIGWGILGVIYVKWLYPLVSKIIELIPQKVGTIVAWTLILFMTFNIILTILVSVRQYERKKGEPAKNSIDDLLDKYFPDEKLDNIFENRKEVGA